ncbi:hypothetical protein H9P43_004556 [Blastocladiella emersonii ATCC 22665]|nr:hypothetical protein H9P43_004556 [Blastocladiella emersonii ATCC 22665]
MAPMKVIVCGGAGYIGSHCVRELWKLGKDAYEIVVVDNLSTGHIESVPEGVAFEKADIRDKASLVAVFDKHRPHAVFHFCASIVVSESCTDPLGYYENNVTGTLNMLEVMHQFDVKYFIFSSTAAVFGIPQKSPIEEDDAKLPVNPYGETKLAVERILHWCDQAYGIKSVVLRYFNACGADDSGAIGEDHAQETHLIPVILQVPLAKREQVFIYGDDYPTKDGTCIRDYVHVTDLSTAHIKALEYLVRDNTSNQFNLGSGQGYSVKEIIDAARKVTGHPIPAGIRERRAGDPPSLVAASTKAEKVLGWTRKYTSVEDIVASAWKFHQAHPKGY